jgi:hypothetical protein
MNDDASWLARKQQREEEEKQCGGLTGTPVKYRGSRPFENQLCIFVLGSASPRTLILATFFISIPGGIP